MVTRVYRRSLRPVVVGSELEFISRKFLQGQLCAWTHRTLDYAISMSLGGVLQYRYDGSCAQHEPAQTAIVTSLVLRYSLSPQSAYSEACGP